MESASDIMEPNEQSAPEEATWEIHVTLILRQTHLRL
jgi:hypothetical protein